jgi:hypothetical protein
MGKQRWVGVRLDYKVKWGELAAILKDPDVNAKQVARWKSSRTRRCCGFDRRHSKTNLSVGATKADT